jgi:hypothetical protein
MSIMDVKEKEGHGQARYGRPEPPRWWKTYMVVLLLGLLAYIVLDVMHGGPPWEHHWWP